MTPSRIPPRPAADCDAAVHDALSVLRPPDNAARPAEPAGDARERPVSNMIGIFAWHPELTKAFLVFNNHLFRSTLSARVRELATVRVAWLRRGEYEWAQHIRMARAAGVTDEELDAVPAGPDAPVWGPLDAAVLRAVDEVIADRYVSDDTWKLLAEHFDRRQQMDLVFTIGSYDLLAMAFNVFGLQLDPGLEGFPPGPDS